MKEGAGRPEAHDVPSPSGGNAPIRTDVHRSKRPEEGPSSKDSTPERIIAEEVYSTIKGGPEAAGIPRRGVDEPGGYENAVIGDVAKRLGDTGKQTVETLPDTMGRVGESVGGGIQHVVEKVADTVQDMPRKILGKTDSRDSEQKRAAMEAPGGELEGAFDPYTHPGGVGGAGVEHGGGTARVMDLKAGAEFSDHRRQKLEGMMSDPNPARKRETFVDKILYPFSKDAGDPQRALEQAKSYFEYVEERKHNADAAAAGGTADTDKEGADKRKGLLVSEETLHNVTSPEHTAADYVRPLVEKADRQGRSGPAKTDEKGEPLTKHDANLLHEREHTLANPNLEEVNRTEKDGPGTGRRYEPQMKLHRTGDAVTETISNFGQAVIDTVTGVFHRSGHDDSRSAADAARDAGNEARDTARDTADRARESARETGDKIRDSAREARDDIRDAARDTGDSASRKTDSALDKAEDTLNQGWEKVSEVARETRENVREGVETAKEKLNEGWEKVAGNTRSATEDARDNARSAGHTVNDRAERLADDTREAAAQRRDEAKEIAHEAGHGVTGLIDSAAAATTNLISGAMDTLASLVGGGRTHHLHDAGHHAAAERHDAAVREIHESTDVGGYGRGGHNHDEPAVHVHVSMPEEAAQKGHDIPVVPFTSTEELMRQRGESNA